MEKNKKLETEKWENYNYSSFKSSIMEQTGSLCRRGDLLIYSINSDGKIIF